jgi:hypothetical protein
LPFLLSLPHIDTVLFFSFHSDFRFGQLYYSLRDEDSGVADADKFYTTNTTKGYLSDGNSHKITINGGRGGDVFDVLRNKEILDLNGQSGDDIFVVRSFVYLEIDDDEGNTSKPDLEKVKLGGGKDNDLLDVLGDFSDEDDNPDYLVNSLVDIDGGTGNDRLIVVGTEFNDKYVVADGKVYGGGLSIVFKSIESLEVTAAEGNDEISVLSTSPNFATVLYGDLGSDTFVICPRDVDPVISKNLRGHRGIIEHGVVTSNATDDDDYKDVLVEGIAVEVHDTDGDFAYVTVYEEDTTHVMDEDGTVFNEVGGNTNYFSFWVYPTRKPVTKLVVQVLSPNSGGDEGEPYFHFFNETVRVLDGVIFEKRTEGQLTFLQNDMSPQKVKVKYNNKAVRIDTTDANLMITLDVVDLLSPAVFVATEQSIQPVNVKLLPQKAEGEAMSVTVVPPSDGELQESSRKLFLVYGKFPHLSLSLFQACL